MRPYELTPRQPHRHIVTSPDKERPTKSPLSGRHDRKDREVTPSKIQAASDAKMWRQSTAISSKQERTRVTARIQANVAGRREEKTFAGPYQKSTPSTLIVHKPFPNRRGEGQQPTKQPIAGSQRQWPVTTATDPQRTEMANQELCAERSKWRGARE